MAFNNSVKICWIHGQARQIINYPISYLTIPSAVCATVHGATSSATCNAYDVNKTRCRIGCYASSSSKEYDDHWAMVIIGI